MMPQRNDINTDEPPEYFREYKQIRNQLNKYDGISIVIETAKYLRAKTKNPIEEGMKHPWNCMLLIKWAALEKNFCIKNERSITYHQLYDLLNRVLNISTMLRKLEDYDHYSLFLRNYAFQQFMYQKSPYIYGIARQSLLFSGLAEDHVLRVKYRERVGIEIEDSIHLSLPLFIFLCGDNRAVFKPEQYGDMIPKYRDKIVPFLDMLSRDRDALHKYLRETDRVKRTSWEYYEETPLVRYPLFRFQDFYVCYSSQVMLRALESHYYTVLKEIDPDWFMTHFGHVFERYVELGLKYTGIEYYTESEIQHVIGSKKKCVDFYVPLSQSGVLIDSKAVELSYSAKASHLREIIANATKQSILKAIEQAHSTIAEIEARKEDDIPWSHKNQYFMLIVTYKELYLSGGSYFYEQISTMEWDVLREIYHANDKMPSRNVFFLTIEEYEILTTMVKEGVSMEQVLQSAAESQSSEKTRGYQFSNYMEGYLDKMPNPKYLIDEFDRIQRELEEIMHDGSALKNMRKPQ